MRLNNTSNPIAASQNLFADTGTDRPSASLLFEHTYCPEELYFQTVLMNSPHAGRVVNDNLRYILWEKRHGSLPAVLDESDFEPLKASGALFARKLSSPVSSGLMALLDQEG